MKLTMCCFYVCGKLTFWVATMSKGGKIREKKKDAYSLKWSRKHFSYKNLLYTQLEMIFLAGLSLLCFVVFVFFLGGGDN